MVSNSQSKYGFPTRVFKFTRGLGIALLAALLLAGCAPPAAEPEVWAEVNGRPIFRQQVERHFQREASTLVDPLSPEEELNRKLDILQGLIERDILLQRAAQQGLLASEQEVSQRLEEERGTQTQEEFERELDERGWMLADYREELRASMTTRNLFDEVTRQGSEVTEQEIQDYFEAHRQRFHLVEAQYRVAVILVTPRREPDVRNLANNDARSPADARTKIQTLVERLRGGEDFEELARQYSEDPVTTLQGGDLGFFPESALQETHPSLRSAVRSLEQGRWSGPISTPDGILLVKLLDYEAPGQRNLEDESVQQTIRNRLSKQKRDLLEAAYLEQARNQSRVVNYLARQVLETGRVQR